MVSSDYLHWIYCYCIFTLLILELMPKLTTQEMQLLRLARPDIAPGMRFRHYRGGLYEITAITLDKDTEEMEARVVFKRVDGPSFDAKAEQGLLFDTAISNWKEPEFVRERPSN